MKASTIASPEGMLVILTNLDYELKLVQPYRWNPRENVEIALKPPEGFEPAEFLWIRDGEKVPLEGGKTGPAAWECILPRLPVAEMILVLPEP